MVISSMPVLLILILVSLKLGLGDVVTYDVPCGESCEKKCADKGFEFEKCAKGTKLNGDMHAATNEGEVPYYCTCKTPPCMNGKERCKDVKFSCAKWKGSLYCNPKTNQCECTCDPAKCYNSCGDQGKGKCVDDVSYGLKCTCKGQSGGLDECDSDEKQKKAFVECSAKYAEFSPCTKYGEMVCVPQPAEVKKNRTPCKCNCNADRCKDYCKKQKKMGGQCKPLATRNAEKYKLQGETCECT